MKKTTKTSKSVKVVNASDVIIKSKDNRKASTIDKVASSTVKGFTMEKAEKVLATAHAKSENAIKEKAKAFYAIKSLELYKPQFETFKDFINSFDDGTMYGVKYNQASNLANIWHYVWADKTLNVYDSNKATSLVAYVKKDYAKVVKMHNNGTISENMPKEDIVKALKKSFGSECKTVKEGTPAKDNDVAKELNIAINTIEKIVVAYNNELVKRGKKEKAANINHAWDVILDELCK